MHLPPFFTPRADTVNFKLAISLLTSCITLYGMWVIGSKKWWGWLVGLGNQVVWLTFIVTFQAWGLLPLSAALVVVYTRNLFKWRSAEIGVAL